ncbi:AAA family ATPase [Propionibacteriaceae bacterium Y1923]
MLDADAPLPLRPRRVVVAGVSGSGKTTLAGRIAEVIGCEHVEIDGLFHGPDWVPRAEFMDDVRALVAQDSWVTEWQYRPARPVLLERADLMVWLDLPYWRVTLPRVVSRTVRRRVRRQVLWNGNLEPPLRTFFTDPEHIVRWSYSTRHKYREQVLPIAAADGGPEVVRLRSQRQVERWLAGPLARSVRGAG